jgi:hypothetical protein
MDNIADKVKYYMAYVFWHYKSNYGDNYSNIKTEMEYERWFEEFKWKATCNYYEGYDIVKKYPVGEFFNYDMESYEDILSYINNYYRETQGEEYILQDCSSENVMRHYAYIYVNKNNRLFYDLCKPELSD